MHGPFLGCRRRNEVWTRPRAMAHGVWYWKGWIKGTGGAAVLCVIVTGSVAGDGGRRHTGAATAAHPSPPRTSSAHGPSNLPRTLPPLPSTEAVPH